MNTKNTSDSTHKTGIFTSNDVMPCCQSTSNGTIRTQLVNLAYSDVFAGSNSHIITLLLTEQSGNSQEGGGAEGETQNTR